MLLDGVDTRPVGAHRLDANLAGANLIEAHLLDANLADANLINAHLLDANLIEHALFGGVQ